MSQTAKPTIEELEALQDQYGDRVRLVPGGGVEILDEPLDPGPLPSGWYIAVGDDNAMIYWGGTQWEREREAAHVFDNWESAKRQMAQLRHSHGSTIRTQTVEEAS